MASDIVFERGTMLHALQLAPTLCPEDVLEVQACGYQGALDALLESVKLSAACWAGVVDGAVACMVGLCEGGVVWFLTGLEFRRHARAFIRLAPFVMRDLLERSGRLGNYIDARYTAAVRWAKWLGFEVGEPIPMGPGGELFYPAVYRRA